MATFSLTWALSTRGIGSLDSVVNFLAGLIKREVEPFSFYTGPWMIGIIDHGMGNIQSVVNAFERLDVPVTLATSSSTLMHCNGIVLPGVGAFGQAMKNLRQMDVIDTILTKVQSGCPILGICLGMQLLASESEEHGVNTGLGLIPGKVRLIPTSSEFRLPHIGWNTIRAEREDPLFSSISDGSAFYFVHSYRFECDRQYVSAITDYGVEVVAGVRRGAVFGVQFHPEKSQASGRRLLRNFAKLVEETDPMVSHA